MFNRVLIVGALAVSSVNAFFRMPCSQPVVVERSDPIVNPGAISGHVHTIMGGSAFNFSQTFEQSRAASCTSCKAKQDRSNYWTPSLFYQAQDGTFHQVEQNGGATIYYLQRKANDAEQLLAFPPGFRILAGDPGLRSYDPNSLAQQAISFVCLNYKGGTPQTNGIPNINCPDGLRTQIFFPSCWDGVNLDSANHKDHMAYPDGMDNGKCPPTHPKRLISIFYEIIWNTGDWSDKWWHADGSHPFVLSMGDPTGYGFHGDFLNGWDINALQTAIDKCTQQSGVIEDCQQYLELLSDAEMQDCVNPSRVDEDLSGWLPSLPGCNPVQTGPGRATPQTCPQKTTPAILSLDQVSFIKQDVPLWDGVGCAQDDLNNRLLSKKFTDFADPHGYTLMWEEKRTDKVLTLNSPAMTIEKCVDTCHSNNFNYAGLQWGVECWCGNTFDESKANLYGKCNQPCAGDASEMCGNGQVLSVYKYNPNKASTPSNPTTPSTPTTIVTTSTPTTTTVATNPATSTTATSTATSTVVSNPSNPTTSPTTTNSPTTTTLSPTTTVPSSGSGSGSGSNPGDGATSGHAPTGWTYRGCFVHPLTPRALPNGMWYGVPMTPQACTDHCTQRGFAIAGTEYTGECFCGNAFVNSSGKVKQVDERQCNMPCRGDGGIICGGPARLSIYTKGDQSLNVRDLFDEIELDQRDEHKREASPNPNQIPAFDSIVNSTKLSKRTDLGSHSHGRLRRHAHNRLSFAENLLN